MSDEEIIVERLENLMQKIGNRAGLNIADAGKFPTKNATMHELALNVIFFTIRWIKEKGLDGSNFGLTRFMSEWHFDEDLYEEAANIQDFYYKTCQKK